MIAIESKAANLCGISESNWTSTSTSHYTNPAKGATRLAGLGLRLAFTCIKLVWIGSFYTSPEIVEVSDEMKTTENSLVAAKVDGTVASTVECRMKCGCGSLSSISLTGVSNPYSRIVI